MSSSREILPIVHLPFFIIWGYDAVVSKTNLNTCLVEFVQDFCRRFHSVGERNDIINEARVTEQLSVDHDAFTLLVELTKHVFEISGEKLGRNHEGLSCASVDKDLDFAVKQPYCSCTVNVDVQKCPNILLRHAMVNQCIDNGVHLNGVESILVVDNDDTQRNLAFPCPFVSLFHNLEITDCQETAFRSLLAFMASVRSIEESFE
jgi:hypothetical protein